MLLLLLPKRNRCLQALWVAVPLAVTLAVEFELWWASAFGADAPDEWFEGIGAVLVGLAAVWLLSPYLKAGGRWVTFLRLLATLAAFSFFTRAVGQSPEGDGGWADVLMGGAVLFGLAAVWLLSPYLKAGGHWVTFLRLLATLAAFSFFTFAVEQSPEGDGGSADVLMGVAVFGLVLGVALNLAGWSCRRRYDWRRFSLWLILWLMACWLAAFAVVSMIFRPGPLLEMETTLLMVSAVSFGLLLPFLLLSFTNAFYRARLHEVLRLAEAAPPPAPQPPAPIG